MKKLELEIISETDTIGSYTRIADLIEASILLYNHINGGNLAEIIIELVEELAESKDIEQIKKQRQSISVFLKKDIYNSTSNEKFDELTKRKWKAAVQIASTCLDNDATALYSSLFGPYRKLKIFDKLEERIRKETATLPDFITHSEFLTDKEKDNFRWLISSKSHTYLSSLTDILMGEIFPRRRHNRKGYPSSEIMELLISYMTPKAIMSELDHSGGRGAEYEIPDTGIDDYLNPTFTASELRKVFIKKVNRTSIKNFMDWYGRRFEKGRSEFANESRALYDLIFNDEFFNDKKIKQLLLECKLKREE